MPFPDDYQKPQIATIVCDWFEVSGKCESYYINHDIDKEFDRKMPFTHTISSEISLTYLVSGTMRYAKTWKVGIGNKTIGTLFTEPRNSDFMEKCRVNFQMNNEWLYTQDWVEEFKKIVEVLQIELTNISRLDVAVDGCNDVLRFVSNYLKQDKPKKVIKVGQASVNTQYYKNELAELRELQKQLEAKIKRLERKDDTGKLFTQTARALKHQDKTMVYDTITFGSRASDKYLVLYHKSKELERSQKGYIREFWERNGLMDYGNVNRIEIRYNNKYLEHFPEFFNDMAIVQNPEKLAALFFRSTERYFDFRHNTSSHVDKCKKIELIPRDILKADYLTKVEIPIRDNLFAAKVGIKSAVMQILNNHQADKQDEYKAYVKQTIENYHLFDWYESRFALWKKTVKTQKETGHIYELENLF